MTNRPKPTHRFVYVIGPAVGLQKIGIATDPKQRLATLQTAVPFDLYLHLAVPVPFHEAHAIERRAHRLLAKACVRNEWFEATAQQAIGAVQSAVAPRSAAKAAAPIEWQACGSGKAPSVAPLVAAGRQFRPAAAFHKAPEPSPLPLFDYLPPAIDEQAMVDRALDVLVRRISG